MRDRRKEGVGNEEEVFESDEYESQEEGRNRKRGGRVSMIGI